MDPKGYLGRKPRSQAGGRDALEQFVQSAYGTAHTEFNRSNPASRTGPKTRVSGASFAARCYLLFKNSCDTRGVVKEGIVARPRLS